MAYIYSIRKGGRGYIGLASGAASHVDYQKSLGAREPLDRMLQHIDNAYGLQSSYALVRGTLDTETSKQLEQALRSGGACKCYFSYNDDEDSCFGIGDDLFQQFSKIWESSAYSPKMQFAELIYIYHFRKTHSSWNNQPGSQGNYTLKIEGLIPEFSKLKKELKTELKEIGKQTTWSSKGFTTNSDDSLNDLFWPEKAIAEGLSKHYKESFMSISEYRDVFAKSLGKSGNWKETVTLKDLAELIKGSLKKDGIKKDVQDLVKKKIEKIKPTAKILKDTLNITVVFPSETQIDNYVEKVCGALMDTKKKGDNIKIDNLITAIYEEPTVKKKPSWYPEKLVLPKNDATQTVRIHCASRAIFELERKDNNFWPTLEIYQQIFGLEDAMKFLRNVYKLKQAAEGSLEVLNQEYLDAGGEWAAFGRPGIVDKFGNTKKLFSAPADKIQEILEADKLKSIWGLPVY